MTIPITWRVTSIGGHTNDPNDGTAYDGSAPIGRAMLVSDGHVELFGAWSWSMWSSGHGGDYQKHRGREATREAAKGGCRGLLSRPLRKAPGQPTGVAGALCRRAGTGRDVEEYGELPPAPLVSERAAADA
ncbi:hypothetical protein [uncultured Enterovirga sp.]|uniref:hypothetical protein n=1 Tax=uncultured Enterovirga sp. TaxID=2026352 RepID=UPI0035C983E0